MSFEIIGLTRDQRTNTPVVYAKMDIESYLSIVGTGFEDFFIQRKRESHKAYHRLEIDLKEGALLPAISLAVKPQMVADLQDAVESAQSGDFAALSVVLNKQGMVDILDGLQRTYILRDIKNSGHKFIEGQEVLVEFWLEGDLKNLIYRMIVLNAGQKPMSMRHQIELLFMSLSTHLIEQINGLEIYTERDGSRRRKAKKFSLSLIASGYHAFLTSSAELQKENIVASKMMDSNALDASKQELGDTFDQFIEYFRKYVEIDEEVFRVYSDPGDAEGDEAPTGGSRHWMADENVFLGFFAAASQFGNVDSKKERILAALSVVQDSLKESNVGEDPLALEKFDRLKKGANPRASNVGVATRRLITNGFKEFFRESGEQPFDLCWELAAD